MPGLLDLALSTIFMVSVSIVAVFGNLLVILAVACNKKLQTIANVLFLNLAIADFFQGSVSIPLRLAEQLNQTDNEKPLIPCVVVIPLTIFFYGASNLNMTIISVDRFIALYRPMKYKNIVTPLKMTLLVLACWVVVFILAVLPVLGWGSSEERKLSDICLFTTALEKEYLLLLFSIINLGVLVILSGTNFFILRTARNQIRRINCSSKPSNETINTDLLSTMNPTMAPTVSAPTSAARRSMHGLKYFKKRTPFVTRASGGRGRRATKVVLIIVGLFVALTTPITVIDILSALGSSIVPPLLVIKLAVCMAYSNACVNVFIYAGYNKEMRDAWIAMYFNVKKLVRNCRRKRQISPCVTLNESHSPNEPHVPPKDNIETPVERF